MGIFHPHEDVHNIKKENIGLIEVMGLAVLPARLNKELADLGECLIRQDLPAIEKSASLKKHAAWARVMVNKYTFTPQNTAEILQKEVGKIFARVLEYAGVFKRTPDGQAALNRFIKKL